MPHDLIDSLGHVQRLAGCRGHCRLHQIAGKGREVAVNLPAIDPEIELGHDLIARSYRTNRRQMPIVSLARFLGRGGRPVNPDSASKFEDAGRLAPAKRPGGGGPDIAKRMPDLLSEPVAPATEDK